MHIFMTGAGGGIGTALREVLVAHTIRTSKEARPALFAAEAVICCAGTNDCNDALSVNLQWTIDAFEINRQANYFIAFAGAGIGGPPALNMSAEYVASKAGVVVFVEQFALRYPDKHVFAVSPGLCDTKINVGPERGAHPSVPAKFVARLLTGKYHHLSGSLLAAQRDDLDTMGPMRLRRRPE